MELANRGPRKGLRSKAFWGEEEQWSEGGMTFPRKVVMTDTQLVPTRSQSVAVRRNRADKRKKTA